MLYLFDGYNILHAGDFADRRELITLGELRGRPGARRRRLRRESARTRPTVRSRCASSPADPLLERLAAENRRSEEVWVISSDRAVRGTAGQETRRISSNTFVRELSADPEIGRLKHGSGRSQIEGALDDETRERLERFRRSR